MLDILKLIYYDLLKKSGRYEYLEAITRHVPGRAGIELRRFLYKNYFGRAGEHARIHQDVSIRNIEKLFLGTNVSIGEKVMIQAAGTVEIGDRVLIGPDTKIWSVNHTYSDSEAPIISQGYCHKKVVIHEDCWIGANTVILPGTVIGKGVIIGASSVVPGKTIPPFCMIAGNPAKIIKYREKADPQK